MASDGPFAADSVMPSEGPALSRRALFVGAAAGASLSLVAGGASAAQADRTAVPDPCAPDYRETAHVRAAYARMRF